MVRKAIATPMRLSPAMIPDETGTVYCSWIFGFALLSHGDAVDLFAEHNAARPIRGKKQHCEDLAKGGRSWPLLSLPCLRRAG